MIRLSRSSNSCGTNWNLQVTDDAVLLISRWGAAHSRARSGERPAPFPENEGSGPHFRFQQMGVTVITHTYLVCDGR
jgi:hypothetical protein